MDGLCLPLLPAGCGPDTDWAGWQAGRQGRRAGRQAGRRTNLVSAAFGRPFEMLKIRIQRIGTVSSCKLSLSSAPGVPGRAPRRPLPAPLRRHRRGRRRSGGLEPAAGGRAGLPPRLVRRGGRRGPGQPHRRRSRRPPLRWLPAAATLARRQGRPAGAGAGAARGGGRPPDAAPGRRRRAGRGGVRGRAARLQPPADPARGVCSPRLGPPPRSYCLPSRLDLTRAFLQWLVPPASHLESLGR